MNNNNELTIQSLEDRLISAMINSDIEELNELLADDLIFTNHLGQVMTKQDDLDAHKTGILKIDSIEIADREIKLTNDCAIVNVRVRIVGSYNDEFADSNFRFSRIWSQNSNGDWQVVMAHSTAVT